MNLQGRNLSLEMRGSDVALLHAELAQIGYTVADDETGRNLFGPATRDAVVQFQRRRGLTLTGVVDEATARAINLEVGSAGAAELKVRGTIRSAGGSLVAGATVRAYDVDLTTVQLLGESQTNADGFYEILYGANQFAAAERRTSDVRVDVYVGNDLRAQSDVLFNAPPIAVVNLFLDDPNYQGFSEFERLVQEITPLLTNQNVAIPTLDESHVAFLSNETGIEALKIAFFVVAHRVAANLSAPLEPAVFYGFSRQGLPTVLQRLLTQGPAAWESALRAAAAANIVPASLDDNRLAILQALRDLAVQSAAAPSAILGWSSLGDHLRLVNGLAVDPLKQVVGAWLSHAGTVAEFWTALGNNSEVAPYVGEIQTVLQLGAITQSHEWSRELRIAGEATMGLLAAKTAANWIAFFDAHSSVPIPNDVEGANLTERKEKYAALLVKIVEDTVPTLAIRERLVAAAPGQQPLEDTLAFLQANTEVSEPAIEFDFRTTFIDGFVTTAPGLPVGDERLAACVGMLKTHQRLFRVSHRFAEIDAMRSRGFDSAHTITRLGRTHFLDEMTSVVGAAGAEEMYQRAEHAAALALHLYGRFGAAMNETSLPAMPSSADMVVGAGGPMRAAGPLPSYSKLFGGLDYCGCEHCASVLSPAAYLVDLLDMTRRTKVGNATALDALTGANRRPDLTRIHLTCENSDRALPYIDLANEVMEQAIAPEQDPARQTTFDEKVLRVQPEHVNAGAYTVLAEAVYPWSLPFDLPGEQGRAYLAPLGVRREEIMRLFRHPLAPDQFQSPSDAEMAGVALGLPSPGWRTVTGGLEEKAPVRVATTGNVTRNGLQVIDGVGVVAGDRVLVKNQNQGMDPEKENGIFVVVANGDWARAADADSTNDLHRGLYVTVREGGQQNTRWVMTASIADPPGYVLDQTKLTFEQSAQAGDKDIFPNAWQYWGYGGQNQPAAFLTDLQGVKELLRRSGMSWDDLVALLRTRYVNSSGSLQIQWTGTGCDLTNATIPAMTIAATRRIHRFERLRRLIGWSAQELDQALSAVGAVEITDEAVMKVAEMDRQHRELGVPIEEVLAWWGPFQCRDYGVPSLYERLFLNPAVQTPPNPTFALNFDRTDTAFPAAAISDHAPAVMAALGIGPQELALLLLRLPVANVRLFDLTVFFRTVSLARALRLSLLEFMALLDFTDTFLVVTGARGQIERLRDAAARIRRSGFSMKELAWLFTEILPISDMPPSTADVDRLVAALRSELQKVWDANPAAPADEEGARTLLAQRLALVLGADKVAEVLAVIDDTASVNGRGAIFDDNLRPVLSDVRLPNALDAIRNELALHPGNLTILGRLQLVDVPLREHLILARGSAVLKQKLADALKVTPSVVEALLPRIEEKSATALALFLDERFLSPDNNPGLALDAANVSYRLFKAGFVVLRLKLTASDVGRLMDLEKDHPALWLDFNELPVYFIGGGPTQKKLFADWERLWDLVEAQAKLPRLPKGLLDVLETAAANPPPVVDDVKAVLAEATGWDPVEITFLATRFAFTAAGHFLGVVPLRRFADAFATAARLGVAPSQAAPWSSAALTLAQANEIRRAARGKHGLEPWIGVATPIQDGLRERQRGALLAHLAAQPVFAGDPKRVYDRYLIDPEMSACQLTSRIKQAVSSVQLFIQRALMNLEAPVTFDEVARRDWSWMSSYRVWEANRKVFLYPENWIEPDLRDDKSPFFQELESELAQSDLTDDSAEAAYRHYLEKLDLVARLEICGLYHDQRTDPGGSIDVLHVFARTNTTPRIYFYRRRINARYWTAWERVDLDIESDQLMPYVVNSRLHLFWPVFIEKGHETSSVPSAQDKATIDKEVQAQEGLRYLEIRLAWSEYRNGRWSPKVMTIEGKILSTRGLSMERTNRAQWTFKVREESSDLVVQAAYFPVAITGNQVEIPRNSLTGAFRLSGVLSDGAAARPGCGTEVDVVPVEDMTRPYWLMPLPGSLLRGNRFVEGSSRKDDYLCTLKPKPGQGNQPLANDGGIVDQVDNVRVLNQTPGLFAIAYGHADEQIVEREFFYLDKLRRFYVEPFDVTVPQIAKKTQAHPDIGAVFRQKYYTKPSLVAPRPGLVLDRTIQGSVGEYRPIAPLPELNVPQRLAMPLVGGGNLIGDVLSQENGVFDGGLSTRHTTKGYRFHAFYHPYAGEFVSHLSRRGLSGLLRYEVQRVPLPFIADATQVFRTDSLPVDPVVDKDYPKEDVDFRFGGAYASYNWEVFFHTPLLVADRLMKNQRFEEAQKWFHYIFDPTDASGALGPERYWRCKPFRDAAAGRPIQELLQILDPDAPDPGGQRRELDDQVAEWRHDPFNPHLIARLRITAYARTVVMKYIDNLIAWGDQLFRRDTLESINQAANLYVLAAELLGDRPARVSRSETHPPRTFDQIGSQLDAFANRLIQVENVPQGQQNGGQGGQQPKILGTALYFCVPVNDKLLSYWDVVGDRLFKIRHCMNIEGVVRQLPLFEPPFDPGLLVRAAAAGVDIRSAIADLQAPPPLHRFSILLQKALELANDVRAFGGELLSVLEKRDGEALGLLRAGHESELLALTREVKTHQIAEAQANLAGLRRAREVVEGRLAHYTKLQRRSFEETDQLTKLDVALSHQRLAGQLELAAGIARLIPDFTFGISGVAASPVSTFSIGGTMISSLLLTAAGQANNTSAQANTQSSMAGINASLRRRDEEWAFQKESAARELKQIDQQILAAEIRQALAERELSNHDRQIANARTVEAFLQQKFTSRDLYDWMVSQASLVFFQSYQLAYEMARRAERAFAFERAEVTTRFIEFGYWDNLKKGLLSGERLHVALKRMDAAYLEQNRREYEITKQISLAALDPEQLVQLREEGACDIDLTADVNLFDRDYPGHYMRRVKSVSLTIPCVAGPHDSVSCTLTLLGNTILRSTTPPVSIENFGGIESIATSGAQNDAGLFEVNFRDERYLPFEGAGAVSKWHLRMPRETNLFDFNTIADVILHLKYTAREGGEVYRAPIEAAINDPRTGQRLLSARHDFPVEWNNFLNPPDNQDDSVLALPLQADRLPFPRPGKAMKTGLVTVALKFKDAKVGGIVPATEYWNNNTPLHADLLRDQVVVLARQVLVPAGDRLGGLPFIEGGVASDPEIWTLRVLGADINGDLPVSLKREVAGKWRLKPETVEDVLIIVEYEEA